MASRNIDVSGLSLPTLSDIIELEPEMDPWCAGYAISKGRRCHMHMNGHGRSAAIRLLDQSTDDLRAGRCIDALLENLAPHVLCTRFHQYQASDLVRRWKGQVNLYLSSRAPSARFGDTTRQLSMSVPSREAQHAVLYRKIQDMLKELESLQSAQQEATVASNDPLRRGHGQAREDSTGSQTNHEVDLRSSTQITDVSVTRRAVEGECKVCLCHLQSPRSDLNAIVETGEQEAEEGQNRENDEGRAEEELVWCKAKCGVNFHKACIDQWLGTANAPTCPTCRRIWKF